MDPRKLEDLKINSMLYQAMMNQDDTNVVKICKRIPKGPLHTLTIHEDTVIHMATYHKRTNLVLELLNMVSPCDYHKLAWQNSGGNTILHETGTNNSTVKAAVEMLRKAPMLLSMTNKEGETALFYAARHGKTRIFRFLHDEVQKSIDEQDLKTFLQRDDKFTILHIAILSRNYWIAHYLAIHHSELIAEKDANDMTPLQLLATSKPEFRPRSGFKRIIFKLMRADLEDLEKRWKLYRKLVKEKHKCEWAMKLAKLLIKADNSWERTESWTGKCGLKVHENGKAEQKQTIELHEHKKPDTPLLLATIHGSTEIVREILHMYPQAVEHVDEDGRNILHLAILHRRLEIINVVEEMEYPLDRLRGRLDKHFNTLLHMVGRKADEHGINEDVKHPAQQLKEDQRLYKRIDEITTTVDSSTRNSDSMTPYEVFTETNDNLRAQAKDWMCENAKNCSLVAVLIATVAFTSAYTIPGGPDKTGNPVLKDEPMFIMFTLADAISLSSALTSIIIFLNIVSSTFQFKDFESSIFEKQLIAILLLIISVATMMAAFAATLVLTISNENENHKWKNMIVYGVAIFPVFVFVFPYLLQFKNFVKNRYLALKLVMETVGKIYHKI